MHLSDRLMQQCLAHHLPLALRQALPKPLISAFVVFLPFHILARTGFVEGLEQNHQS